MGSVILFFVLGVLIGWTIQLIISTLVLSDTTKKYERIIRAKNREIYALWDSWDERFKHLGDKL